MPIIKNILAVFIVFSLTACVTTTERSALYNPKESSSDEKVELQIKIAFEYLRNSEAELAVQSLKKGLEIDKRDPRLHEALGLAFQQMQDYKFASQSFKEALRLDPKYSRGRNNYAAFLFQQKKYKEACQQLSLVVKDVYYARRSDAFSNMGLCAKKLNNMKMARQAFQRAVSINPRQANALLELAEMDFEASNFSGAQQYLKRFHEVAPKGSPKSLLLGFRLAKLFGQVKEMVTYKQALERLYPFSPEALRIKSLK